METKKAKWGVLDVLFILVASFAILLLVLWIAGQIIGRDQFSNLPAWTTGMVSNIWSFLISGGVSGALLIWIKTKNATTPNYLLGIGATSLTLLVLVVLAVFLLRSVKPEGPVEAKIHFRLDFPNAPASLAFIQQAPTWKNEIRNIMKQPTGYFQEPIDLPKTGERFVAKMQPLSTESRISDTAVQEPIELCFVRNKSTIPGDNVIAIIKCNKALIFEFENSDPGCIQLCRNQPAGINSSFSLFPAAYGQTISARGKTTGWTVPNLNTLLNEKKTGFTQVILKSNSLSPELRKANRFSYAIRVNGTPIYIDGFSPQDLMQRFSYQEGINLQFGLENLGFSGKNNGFEKIEVIFGFYENTQTLHEIKCSFDYVALRSSEPKSIKADDGSVFQWESIYKTIPNAEYEIFNISTSDIKEATNAKNKIDRASLTYNGMTIVGVIRPPLFPNIHYGVILGLVLPNRQIRFTYPLPEAREMIKWAKQQGNNIFSSSIYLYSIKNNQKM